ncbi:MAG TPA: D-alanyl-D-alanine carboxypeptidase [Pyrinomonadaceae bacterium]|jgi:D-alanyl-D-alanine carboxypeptidase/D-alanyl-D-alanine-endopeptidase (penicillin-binding protein 4)
MKVVRLPILFALLAAFALSAAAQGPAPVPQPTPLVKPALLPVAAPAPDAATPDATLAVPTPTPVSGRLGLLVETTDGQVVKEYGADEQFNPASAVKLATALDALHTFGPQYRFATVIWTDGQLDPATGTINGNLIVSGRDPSFHYEHAVMLARELNRLGIRTVTGDLIVAPQFTMNFSWSARASGENFYDTLDAERRPAAAARAWFEERTTFNDIESLETTPSVAVLGAVYVAPVPPGARQLLTHRSSPLVDILKVLLCYSNNFMAERLGDALGGPTGVERFLVTEVGLRPEDVRLASTSGLGINRLSPRSMMKVYRTLVAELKEHNLRPSDIMPVAGVDPGTLQKRFTVGAARGSVVGKTGTLGRSDGGVSALVGQMRTQTGETLYFVIFNQRGSVYRFRQMQEAIVSETQYARGGPAPFTYTPHTLAMRLADTELKAAKNEYESTSN